MYYKANSSATLCKISLPAPTILYFKGFRIKRCYFLVEKANNACVRIPSILSMPSQQKLSVCGLFNTIFKEPP